MSEGLIKAKLKIAYNTCRENWYQAYGTYEGFDDMNEKAINRIVCTPEKGER